MKTLLRRIPGGQYLQAADRWTDNPHEARDFKSMSRAIEFVERAGYRNLELAFLFTDPDRLATVRLDTIEGFEH